MIPTKNRNRTAIMLALVCGMAMTALTGCTRAFGGQVSVLEQRAPSYQVQMVQDPDQVQVQTRTRQVMQEQTITEQVQVERTVMVPTKVTSFEPRTKTVCVPATVTEQVTVRVQPPTRQVVVAAPPQTIAVGLRAPGPEPLRLLISRLRR